MDRGRARRYGAPMILLTAYIEVAPAERDAIAAGLAKVIPATRTEDGCVEYSCYEDTQQPGRYVFVERWRDTAALDRHMSSPHMGAWMKVAAPRLKSAVGYLYDAATRQELRPK
jgi:quinol monooxygenase YgiN